MTLNDLEPFIILPYKNKQDILFFSSESVKSCFEVLKDITYTELANKIIKNNLIKVLVGVNYVIVIHLYPTDYREKCSLRGGQNLVVGYVIKKRELIKNCNKIISGIEIFFETIKQCAYDKNNVPSSFLENVNKNDSDIIEKLDASIKKINKVVSGSYNCYINSFSNKIRLNFCAKNVIGYKDIDLSPAQRVEHMYKHIAKYSIINKEFWILVNCNDISYYKFKNVHKIFFE